MKRKDINLLIDEIKLVEEQLSTKYGEVIELSFKIRPFSLPWLRINVNNIFWEHYHKVIKECDLRADNSHAETVMFRHLFAMFAHENGYKHEEIADYVRGKYAAMRYSSRNAKNMIKYKNEIWTRYYELIKEVVEKK